ncbi:hypothetical protein [Serratia sp. D1N4]
MSKVILLLVISCLTFLAYGSLLSPEQSTKTSTTEKINTSHSKQLVNPIENKQSSYIKNVEFDNQKIMTLLEQQQKLTEEIENLKNKSNVDYSMWASILLACVTVIITILSVILAIVSIIGYTNFKKSIELKVADISSSVAINEVTTQIDAVAKKEIARLIDEGAFTKHLASAVDMAIIRGNKNPDEYEVSFENYPELDEEDGEQ